jgi:hypothetical protein
VPGNRWDVDAFYDPDPGVAGKMATRFGGFVGEIERFGGLKRFWRGEGEALAEVRLPDEAAAAARPYLLFPPLPDACLHGTFELVDLDAQRATSTPSRRSAFVPVELPGAGTRADEPPTEDRPALVETLSGQLLGWLDRPFALFGHADGALLALEVTRFVQRRFGLGPAGLFVAGSRPPDEPDGHAPQLPLDCPITAFAARVDERGGPESLRSWCDITNGGVRLEVAPGPSEDLLAAPSRLLAAFAHELRLAAEA